MDDFLNCWVTVELNLVTIATATLSGKHFQNVFSSINWNPYKGPILLKPCEESLEKLKIFPDPCAN